MATAVVYNIEWEKTDNDLASIPETINVEIDEDKFDLEDEDDSELVEYISDRICEMTKLGNMGFDYHLEFED